MDKLSLIIKHFCYIIKHGFRNYTKKTIKIIQVNSPENKNVKKVSGRNKYPCDKNSTCCQYDDLDTWN